MVKRILAVFGLMLAIGIAEPVMAQQVDFSTGCGGDLNCLDQKLQVAAKNPMAACGPYCQARCAGNLACERKEAYARIALIRANAAVIRAKAQYAPLMRR